MHNTQGIMYLVDKGGKFPSVGIYKNFRAPFEVNWSPKRKTKTLISCSLKLRFHFVNRLRKTDPKILLSEFLRTHCLETNAFPVLYTFLMPRTKSKQLKTCVKYCAVCAFDDIQLISGNDVAECTRPTPFWPVLQLGHVSNCCSFSQIWKFILKSCALNQIEKFLCHLANLNMEILTGWKRFLRLWALLAK